MPRLYWIVKIEKIRPDSPNERPREDGMICQDCKDQLNREGKHRVFVDYSIEDQDGECFNCGATND